MTYFEDLSVLSYHTGPFDASNWAAPLRTIGWLEHPNPFGRGDVNGALVSKLRSLVEQFRSAYSPYNFRGGMTCSICRNEGLPDPGPTWSQENIFVPGIDVVFVAPGGIVHYIEAHSYLPPAEFIAAVLLCPDPRTSEYRAALRVANKGLEPPLETDEALTARISRFTRRH
jgi:hypothetical protein